MTHTTTARYAVLHYHKAPKELHEKMAHGDSLDWEMGRWLAKQHDSITGLRREQDGTITLTSPGREPFAYGTTTSGGWRCDWENSAGITMTATARHLHSLIPECTRHWLGETT